MATLTNAAESNRVTIYYIPESTWGTTPGSGTVKTARITGSSLVAGKDTEISDEIRADRMVSNIIEVAAMTSGDIEFELSAGSFDDFFQQFLLGDWTQGGASLDMTHLVVKGSSISFTDTTEITIAGADWTDWLSDNQYIKVEGFTNPENNGYFSINGTPSYSGGDTVLTIDQTVVVESGTAYGKLFDAADVILANTLITTNATGNVIDGGGANAFGNLVVGQKVFMDGLAKETGTIVCESTNPTEGDTFTISDGVDSITYEIRTDSSLVTSGNVHVALSDTESTLATNIETAVMAQYQQGNCAVSCTVSTATVTFKNNKTTGGSITESTTTLTGTNFSGGVASTQGFFTVASLIDSDSFSVEETIATDSNSGGVTVVIKGNHLRNPGTVSDITKQSMSMQTSFTDITQYLLHDGLRPSTFDLSFEAGSIVTGTFGFMGSATAGSATDTLGDTGTYTVLASTATEVMNATSNVGDVKKDGTVLSTAVMSIELSGDNSLREQKAVGEKFPAGIGYGRFTLTGTLNAYFEDRDLWDAFLDHDTVSLEWPVEDVDGFTMIFRLPATKFTSDPVAPGGIDEDIMQEIEFTAQRDATLQTMFMIDRFSPVGHFSVA